MTTQNDAHKLADAILNGFSWTSKQGIDVEKWVYDQVKFALREAEKRGLQRAAEKCGACSGTGIQESVYAFQNKKSRRCVACLPIRKLIQEMEGK